MVAFLQKHEAPFDLSDFAEYFARVEEPARTTYRGYTVYKHGFGSQGPVLLQTLNILENFDLRAMGYASADYLHTVVEAMKLAYADRDTYYADPAFVQVPGEGLLSKDYARERAALIDPKKASTTYIAGDPLKYDSRVKEWTFWKANVTEPPPSRQPPDARDDSSGVVKDTTHMSVDRQARQHLRRHAERRLGAGRGDSWRHRHRHERARRAVLAGRDAGQPDPAAGAAALHADAEPGLQGRHADDGIGTPGGDNQDQTILQALLSTIDFWDDWYPNLHVAFERPRAQTAHFYGSFWPHTAGFNELNVEAAVPDAVYEELKSRGHNVSRLRQFGMSGCATAVMIDPASGNRIAAADPRRDCYAIAY